MNEECFFCHKIIGEEEIKSHKYGKVFHKICIRKFRKIVKKDFSGNVQEAIKRGL